MYATLDLCILCTFMKFVDLGQDLGSTNPSVSQDTIMQDTLTSSPKITASPVTSPAVTPCTHVPKRGKGIRVASATHTFLTTTSTETVEVPSGNASTPVKLALPSTSKSLIPSNTVHPLVGIAACLRHRGALVTSNLHAGVTHVVLSNDSNLMNADTLKERHTLIKVMYDQYMSSLWYFIILYKIHFNSFSLLINSIICIR